MTGDRYDPRRNARVPVRTEVGPDGITREVYGDGSQWPPRMTAGVGDRFDDPYRYDPRRNEGGVPAVGGAGGGGWHEAAVRAVLALHSPDDAGYCRECDGPDGEPIRYPCGTVATVNDVRTSRLARD